MFTILLDHVGSMLVLFALAALITSILLWQVKKKRRGGSSCGCGCSSCPMADKCHPKK